MDQVIVTLDGKDHKIGFGEHTMCMLPVPHGTTREEDAKPCPVCFPKDEEQVDPEPVFAINTAEPEPPAEAEEVTSEGSVEADPVEAAPSEPAKPVKKASKKAAKAK